jgi:hypothetical protein
MVCAYIAMVDRRFLGLVHPPPNTIPYPKGIIKAKRIPTKVSEEGSDQHMNTRDLDNTLTVL